MNFGASRGMAQGGGLVNKVVTVKNVTTKTLIPMAREKLTEILARPSVRALPKTILIELRPPTPMELPQAFRDGYRILFKGNWRNTTMREAWVNTLVTTEVICWFFIGECIGKGTWIAYQV